MESTEQALKAKITQDLREGRVSRNLILLVLGEGGLRLTRNQLDVIFEWMVQNTNAWRVVATPDDRRFAFVVVFAHSPFHPDEWDNCEDYKHVMRQMSGEFGEYKAEDFFTSRTTETESDRIFRDFIDIGRQIKLYDYVTFDFDGVRTLGRVIDGGIIDGGILNEIHTVKILSGGSCGRYCTVGEGDNVSRIEPGEAMKELARQKEEWKKQQNFH